ncbi:MAG: transcriptional antiterminator, partial [Erysipelothrix sp.]|nr:transcriptional antiterminator [Erysipelothrix sp.]
MIIKKIFNNNCVLADEDLNEVIVTGSGVGFQKK